MTNILLIFFALPIATIIISIALQKILKNPALVAAVIFAIFLIVTFAINNINLLVATIIYTILSLITALIVQTICRIIERLGNNNEGNCPYRRNNNNGNNNSNNDFVAISSNDLNNIALTNNNNSGCGCNNNNNSECGCNNNNNNNGVTARINVIPNGNGNNNGQIYGCYRMR